MGCLVHSIIDLRRIGSVRARSHGVRLGRDQGDDEREKSTASAGHNPVGKPWLHLNKLKEQDSAGKSYNDEPAEQDEPLFDDIQLSIPPWPCWLQAIVATHVLRTIYSASVCGLPWGHNGTVSPYYVTQVLALSHYSRAARERCLVPSESTASTGADPIASA